MPAVAAHYQLAHLALARLPETVQELVAKHQTNFDVAAQGPDLFFYYRPIFKNEVAPFGHGLHRQTGASLFAPLVDGKPVEDATMAYLLGLACHYALDRNCHPLINQHSCDAITHQALESQFERWIVDHFDLPDQRQRFVKCKGLEADAIARVYPTLDAKVIKESSIWLHYVNALFAFPKLIAFIEKAFVKKGVFSSLCMPDEVSNSVADDIFPLFENAVEDAVSLMTLITSPDISHEMLSRAMHHNFEGVVL